MKVLLHQWPSLMKNDISEILREDSISFDCLDWDFLTQKDEEAFFHHVRKNITLKHYDLLFSVNYWPLLSVICQEAQIPYVAWCYDAPLNTENIEETLGNDVNHVFCFDRMQASSYQNQGFSTVSHLPLGIYVKRLSQIHEDSPKCIPYRSQVSFVGKLYQSVADWLMLHSDEYCRGYLQSLINVQRELYGINIIDQSLTDNFMKRMNETFAWSADSQKVTLRPEQVGFALNCEATRRDRIILLSLCGARFHTKLFTYDTSFPMKNVELCPPVDYLHQMPYVFAASKVNLNISLRSIQTGIPLRALDIMGCGGFLMSNYQEELEEHFQDGTDAVLYESIEDALEKIKFYLAREDLRKQIAQNGRKKTFENFDLRERLAIMFRSITG